MIVANIPTVCIVFYRLPLNPWEMTSSVEAENSDNCIISSQYEDMRLLFVKLYRDIDYLISKSTDIRDNIDVIDNVLKQDELCEKHINREKMLSELHALIPLVDQSISEIVHTERSTCNILLYLNSKKDCDKSLEDEEKS